MARIDVSELLHDPDFCDNIQIVSRVPKINSLGENTLTETCVNTVGSVQPASGKTLQRLPEAMRMIDISSFWFQGTITATSPGKYSDVLVFRGVRYQIIQVMNWMNFGDGYCEGVCTVEKPTL